MPWFPFQGRRRSRGSFRLKQPLNPNAESLLRKLEAEYSCHSSHHNLHNLPIDVADDLADRGRYNEALAAYEQVLHFDPQDVDAYGGKGDMLKELHRHEGALAAYQQAIHCDPNNAF